MKYVQSMKFKEYFEFRWFGVFGNWWHENAKIYVDLFYCNIWSSVLYILLLFLEIESMNNISFILYFNLKKVQKGKGIKTKQYNSSTMRCTKVYFVSSNL